MNAQEVGIVGNAVVLLVGFGLMLWKGARWTQKVVSWMENHDKLHEWEARQAPSGAANGEEKTE